MILGLNPWQFLIYIAALEMILAPFIIALFNAYYKAKYVPLINYINAILKGVMNALDKAMENVKAKGNSK